MIGSNCINVTVKHRLRYFLLEFFFKVSVAYNPIQIKYCNKVFNVYLLRNGGKFSIIVLVFNNI